MQKQITVLLLIFITVSCSNQLTSQENSYIPKLPIYAGMGYNVLEGNPLHSDRVDPGFTHTVFTFTYKDQKSTEDKNYLIPDQLQQIKVTSCTYSTQIGEYRGTSSYQTQLGRKASIHGKYEGLIVKSSFSASSSFEQMHNQTVNNKHSVTQAIAECQNYKLGVNLFVIDNLSPNFIAGALNCFNNGNWSTFYLQFGSHFAYQVIMGGRAIQQISYKEESVSVLRSFGVDLSVAASASFAKLVGDTSFDYNKHKTETSYAQQYRHSRKQIYIGGQPTLDGNLTQWQKNVIKDPMPITYKLLPLTQLFDEVETKFPQFDSKIATEKYQSFLDEYCKQIGCKAPVVDNYLPNQSKLVVNHDKHEGGRKGGRFEWYEPSLTMNLKKVLIRSGEQIDQIQIMIGDDVKNLYSGQYGGKEGGYATWTVPDDEYITQIQYRSGKRIDSITFITNKGNKSPKFGGGGGSYKIHKLPENSRIIGIYGKAGHKVDRLGFIVGTTEYKIGNKIESILLKP